MEAYPEAYVAHNLPLIILSGLPQAQHVRASTDESHTASNGIRLSSDIPLLAGHHAEQIHEEFLKLDGASLPWSDHVHSKRAGLVGFSIASTGRVGRGIKHPLSTPCLS